MSDISRRGFLAGLAGLFALFSGFLWFRLRRKSPPVRFAGPAMERGHVLRSPFTPVGEPAADKVEVSIIGGGISGMSAAWHLQKKGLTDFTLFELEDRAGGNAAWGENRSGRYPWGAHYLPTPGPDAGYVRELLSEMGIYKDGKFGAEFLVHEPEERLFIYGQWQQGLVPLMGARSGDRREIEKFSALMQSYRNLRGQDGRRAFTIPLEASSRDPKLLALDRITAKAFLQQKGFTSQRLMWYIDYVLRDEYGSNRTNTSAWAFLHYFSARSESHNLVWPEGNGFIAEYLRGILGRRIESGHSLRRIDKEQGGYTLYFQDFSQNRVRKIFSRKIIFAAPKFILPYVYPNLTAAKAASARAYLYSPWLTVNLLVNHFARTEPAWDNVTFGSKSLGYVVAEHQRAGKLMHARTLTFFHALDADDTLNSRRRLLQMTKSDIYDFALSELKRPHPDIEAHIEEVGIYRWAHAMIRPVPGFITGEVRRSLFEIDTNFIGAHSDLSGMSNFEEAQYRGVEAAKKVLSS